jgi:hypothetical protein
MSAKMTSGEAAIFPIGNLIYSFRILVQRFAEIASAQFGLLNPALWNIE